MTKVVEMTVFVYRGVENKVNVKSCIIADTQTALQFIIRLMKHIFYSAIWLCSVVVHGPSCCLAFVGPVHQLCHAVVSNGRFKIPTRDSTFEATNSSIQIDICSQSELVNINVSPALTLFSPCALHATEAH